MKTNLLINRATQSLVFFVLLFHTSCKNFVEVDPPSNQVVSELVFTDDKTASSSVLGLYIQMMNSTNYLMNGAMTLYPALSADELTNTTVSNTLDPFKTNTLLSTSTVVATNIWRYGYSYIYHVNACIEGLNKATNVTPALKTQLQGEMLFMRSYCYFYLVNLFGDIPNITSTDYRINEVMPRTASATVYAQMISDLKEAQNLLLPDYPTISPVRVNKWAVTAFLARVYLYNKEWAKAETESTAVINAKMYDLVNLNAVFLADSKEAILQLIPVQSNNNTIEGSVFIPSSSTVIPSYILTSNLFNAFESADMRKMNWVNKNMISGVVYNYPYKYKVRAGTAKTEYNMLLRFAEQYLIRAEARAQQNNVLGLNSAESDIDIIRNRANLGGTPAADRPTMLLAIEKERQTELFAEWGHRWFDLKRTGRIDAVLTVNKTGWTSTASLYPIPLTEIQRNPFLIPNPGYL